MTSSPDDPTPQAEGAETPAEAPAPVRKPAAKRPASSSAAAKKAAATSTAGTSAADASTAKKKTAAKTPAAKTPAAKTTSAKSTSAKTAASTSTAAKSPAAKTTAAKSPAAKTTSAKSPAAKTAGATSSAGKTAGAKAASAKTTTTKSSTTKSSAAAKSPAAKSPAAKKPAGAPTKAAAEKAAPSSEVVVEPTPAASVDPAAARTASAARTAAMKNTAARTTGSKRPSATTTKPSTAAARTTAAKTAAAKAAAAKTAAAKASAAKTTAKTTAAKTAAAKAAAAKAAAAKAAEAEAAEAEAAEAQAADAEAAAETQPEDSGPVSSPTASAVATDTASAETASDDGITEAATLVEDPAVTEDRATEPAVEVSDTALPVTTEPAPEDGRVAEVEIVEVVDAVIAEEPPAEADDDAAAEPGTEAIRIRGLVKQFGENRAVDGIDLTVPAASFYGIVGPNGAGKTTTLSIVAGLLRADEGSVLICGIDQATDPLAAKRVMGVLPDRLRTFDRLTGRQLLYYYGLLRGLAADVIEKRTGDLARAFDLGDALNRVVSDYSAGMTKKIMLAGAMIHSPRVLVLDEPFESVDPVSSAVILDILRAYVSHGGTVILSSHGMDLVERVCSRVAIIVNGEVLAEGTIDEVRAGQTLESRFVELAGSSGEVEGLEWLHTFSD